MELMFVAQTLSHTHTLTVYPVHGKRKEAVCSEDVGNTRVRMTGDGMTPTPGTNGDSTVTGCTCKEERQRRTTRTLRCMRRACKPSSSHTERTRAGAGGGDLAAAVLGDVDSCPCRSAVRRLVDWCGQGPRGGAYLGPWTTWPKSKTTTPALPVRPQPGSVAGWSHAYAPGSCLCRLPAPYPFPFPPPPPPPPLFFPTVPTLVGSGRSKPLPGQPRGSMARRGAEGESWEKACLAS